MKNLLKKFGVMIASLMLVMTTFVMPSHAVTPTEFTVKGLEEGVTATAYRIVVQKDDAQVDKGATKLVIDDSIKNVDKPTQAEIMALVPKVQSADYEKKEGAQKLGPIAVADGETSVKFTGASSGMYLVTFENTEDAEYVYNPVIVSIKYNDSAAPEFTTGGNFDGTGYAKKTKVPFDKIVERSTDNGRKGNNSSNTENKQTTNDEALVDADGVSNTTNEGKTSNNDGNRGDTANGPKDAGQANVGDTVTFRINTTVPAYADNFFKQTGYLPIANSDPQDYEVKVPGANTNLSQDPEFVVYDSMTKGLTLQDGIKVYEANTNKEIPTKFYEIKTGNAVSGAISADSAKKLNAGDKFAVVFNAAGIAKYRGSKIEIRYDAKVNGEHGVNFDGSKNTGGVDYSRNPGEGKKSGEDKTTYHYTFTINGKIDGNNSIENREVLKVGVDASGNQVFRETTATKETGWEPLKGVTFSLYKKKDGAKTAADYANETAIRTATSDKNGLLRGIDRIDAGEYVLIETDLGEGTLTDGTKYKDKYTKNDTPINVKIEATLDDQGRLSEYKVTVGDIIAGHYKKEYEGTVAGVTYPRILYLNDENQVVNERHTCKIKDKNGTEVNYVNKDGEKLYDANDATAYDYDQDAAHIRNSKVGTLPSTGGMGTILFTVGGIVIMALALFLLFGSRKKQHQK